MIARSYMSLLARSRLWRWALYRAPWWAWTSLGCAGWCLLMLLLLMPPPIVLDEPYWGARGLLRAYESGARLAALPSLAISGLASGIPILALLVERATSHLQGRPPPSSRRVRTWIMAPWLVLPLLTPASLWLALCFARSETHNHIDFAPVPAWVDFIVIAERAAFHVWIAMCVIAVIALLTLALRDWATLAHKTGTCSHCEYDTSTLPLGAVCPECGAPARS